MFLLLLLMIIFLRPTPPHPPWHVIVCNVSLCKYVTDWLVDWLWCMCLIMYIRLVFLFQWKYIFTFSYIIDEKKIKLWKTFIALDKDYNVWLHPSSNRAGSNGSPSGSLKLAERMKPPMTHTTMRMMKPIPLFGGVICCCISLLNSITGEIM